MKILRSLAAPLSIAALTGLAFSPVLAASFFMLDDPENIVKNPYLLSPHGILELWFAPYQQLYIPLTYTLWAGTAMAAKGADGRLLPGPFHALNWAVHIANAVLVFRFLRAWLGLWNRNEVSGYVTPNSRDQRRDLAAAGGALLWTLHPIQTEAVGWATGFKDVSAGFFSLLCLLAWLRARETDGTPGGQIRWLTGATLAFVAALLCKPSSIAVPAVALALAASLPRPRRDALIAWPLVWFSLGAVLAAATQISQPQAQNVAVPLVQRSLVAADALAFYAGKTILPLGLCIHYGRTPEYVLASPQAAISLCLVLLFALALAGLWKKGIRWPAVAASVPVLFLMPVLGLVPFAYQSWSTVADRYMYLALLGPALALSQWLFVTSGSRTGRLVCPAVLVLLTLILGPLSYRQAGYWRSSPDLLKRTLEVNPHSWMAHVFLGVIALRANDIAGAEADFEASTQENPDYGAAFNEVGMIQFDQGQKLLAARSWMHVIALPNADPTDRAVAEAELGRLAASRGQFQSAAALFRAAAQDNPSDPQARALLDQLPHS